MTDQQETLSSRDFVPVCVIGASAGGLNALRSLFKHLPADLGLAYAIALHLPHDQPSVMHELLAAFTEMPVIQIVGQELIEPDRIYVIAPGRDLEIEHDQITSHPYADPPHVRSHIDRLFISMARARGDGLGVVLTGADSDGSQGIRAIKESGGIVLVQDPAEAEYPVMPQHAIATGAVDFIESIPVIAHRIIELAKAKNAMLPISAADIDESVRNIINFVRTRTGHDFSHYKRATMLRRIARRAQLTRRSNIQEYAQLLRDDREEYRELYSDLLISVTTFFRDRAAFEILEKSVVGNLVDGAKELRIWVVGCATGEEAYSVAMLLHEEVERRDVSVSFQIFATDLDEEALAKARAGIYPTTIEAEVSAERLKRFFVDEGIHFRVKRALREKILFAVHSIVRDPPFTNIDLAVCRNVLIYFERQLQAQATTVFHYALKPGGYLFLGPAEAPDASLGAFDTLSREARIFRSRPNTSAELPILPRSSQKHDAAGPSVLARQPIHRTDAGGILGTTHGNALETSAPPSALIDGDHRVLNFSPSAGRFMLLPGGPVRDKLTAIVRPELRGELVIALGRVFEKTPIVTRAVMVAFDSETRQVALYVAALPEIEGQGRRALVCFLDAGPIMNAGVLSSAQEAPQDEIRRLHEDVRVAQESALTSRTEHEAVVQDLRIANEELQSLNEEYRSTAEELEASKEEQQSLNEELHAVNMELRKRVDDVSTAHNDLLNLTTSSEIGTLFLGPDLKIRMFTPPVADLFSISNADVGRPITDFAHRLVYMRLEDEVRRVLRSLTPSEEEIKGPDGSWFLMRIRPYRTTEDKISGVVVTFNNITEHKRDIARRESEARYQAFVTTSSDIVYRMSADWSEMLRLNGRGILPDSDVPTQFWVSTYLDQDDKAEVQRAIADAVRQKRVFEFEHRVKRLDGSRGWVRSRAVPILDKFDEIIEWLGAAMDVTAANDPLTAADSMERRLQLVNDYVPALLWQTDSNGNLGFANYQWHVFTGQTQTQAANSGWLDVIHPDEAEAARAAFDEARATGQALAGEQRLRKADGTFRLFAMRYAPHKKDDGGPASWYGSAIEVYGREAGRDRV